MLQFLTFQLASDPAVNTFSGMSLESGEYVVDTRGKGDIPPGDYKITVRWWVLRDGKPIPGGEEGDTLRNDPNQTIQYSVVFEKTLNAGENVMDLPLEEGKLITVPPEDGG